MKFLKTLAVFLIIGILLLNANTFLHKVLIPHIQKERAQVKRKAILATLDFMHPDFKDLAGFAAGLAPLDTQRWPEFIQYYNLVIKAMPEMAEARLLEGYCQWQNQNKEKSLESLSKAAQLNPNLFWAYYDLGILFLKQGQYSQAAVILNFAVHIPPRACVQSMFSSKIYLDLFAPLQLSAPQIVARLNQGYLNALRLLALSADLAQNPKDTQAKKAANNLTPAIF